jgi:hypothetical protein
MDIKWAAQNIGMRVQSHPATDAWIMGDRYGEIVKVGRTKIHVKMDRSGRTLRFSPEYVEQIDL